MLAEMGKYQFNSVDRMGRLWTGLGSAIPDLQVDWHFGQGPAFPGKRLVRRYIVGLQPPVPRVPVYISGLIRMSPSD